MKNIGWNKKLKVGMVLLCCMLCSVTTIATSKGAYIMNNMMKVYKQYPEAEEIKKEAGFKCKYTEELISNFKFKESNISEQQYVDQNGKVSTQSKSVMFIYERGNEKHDKVQYLFLAVKKVDNNLIKEREKDKVVEQYNGIDLGYREISLNDEVEKKDTGKKVSKNLSWIDGECIYQLGQQGYEDIGQAELVEMAKKIISEEK